MLERGTRDSVLDQSQKLGGELRKTGGRAHVVELTGWIDVKQPWFVGQILANDVLQPMAKSGTPS